jgi:hypothetical protein
MSYESKLDQMIGERVAEYQEEQRLKRKLAAYLDETIIPMCEGYPCSVYHPKSSPHETQTRLFVFKPGGTLSNGVPKVLSGDLVGGYPLGVYNPWLHKRRAQP